VIVGFLHIAYACLEYRLHVSYVLVGYVALLTKIEEIVVIYHDLKFSNVSVLLLLICCIVHDLVMV